MSNTEITSKTEITITTSDNPYDPFDQFDEWLSFDTSMGYHTLPFLARVIVTSDELSDADYDLAYETAINEMLEENVTGMYVKVSREVPQTVP